LLLSSGLVAVSRFIARPPVPDDPDSINFLLAMSERFDLAQLQPHFPGYPLYVGLGSALCFLGLSAGDAASLISAFSSGASALALAVCARRLTGADAAPTVVLLFAVAWLPWLVGSGAMSDELGLALVIGSFALFAIGRPTLAAFAGALVLGTRASYWPLVASVLVFIVYTARRHRPRMFAGFALGLAAWAVPFFLRVSPREWIRLGTLHLKGHFESWGGTIATRPDLLERVRAFARAIVFDGFAPSTAGLLALLGASALARVLERRQVLGRSVLVPLSIALLPYAAWIFFAQNIVEQPRHALPLIAGMLLLLASLLSAHRRLTCVLVAVALATNIPLLLERVTTPPAAAQAAAFIERTHPSSEPGAIAVMAGRSTRFFQTLPTRFVVRQRYRLSEVIVDLARFDRLPDVTLLTSEIDLGSRQGRPIPLPDHWHNQSGPTFCRDPRIDRAESCLGLSMLTWSLP
jgi:hypothetical protein